MKSAARVFVTVMGALMGLAGVEHGIGEIFQGSTPTSSAMILSWPDSAFFSSLGGEPAMTLLPNLLLTGVLALIFSLLFTAWSIFFAHRKHGGLVMIALAVPMLLFGGGIFPPILGALIGAAAALAQARSSRKPEAGEMSLLGRGWPWVFAACCAAWLALLPGVAVLDYFFGVNRDGITLSIMAAAFIMLPIAYVSSIQKDRAGGIR